MQPVFQESDSLLLQKHRVFLDPYWPMLLRTFIYVLQN